MSCNVGKSDGRVAVGEVTEGLENELCYVTGSSLTSPGEPPMPKHLLPNCNCHRLFAEYNSVAPLFAANSNGNCVTRKEKQSILFLFLL